MMTSMQLLHEIELLPADARRLVVELVGALRQGPDSLEIESADPPRENPADSAFVGMWKDRDDLSADWVRELRRREWREAE